MRTEILFMQDAARGTNTPHRDTGVVATALAALDRPGPLPGDVQEALTRGRELRAVFVCAFFAALWRRFRGGEKF